MATSKKKSNKNRKNGKYVSILWLLTGLVIAFFISNMKTESFDISGKKDSLKKVLVEESLPILDETSNLDETSKVQETKNGQDEKTTQKIIEKEETSPAKAIEKEKVISNEKVKTSQKAGKKPTQVEKSSQMVDVALYLPIQKGNAMTLKPIYQSFSYDTNLLFNVIHSLISKRNTQNLIPSDTKLLNLEVKDKILKLDFNDAFSFNSYGVVGYQIQIAQIVYTLTQFSNIDAIAFYIEGQKVEYLGGEGYIIENPVYPQASLPIISI